MRYKKHNTSMSNIAKGVYNKDNESLKLLKERCNEIADYYAGDNKLSEDIKLDIYDYVIDHINKRNGNVRAELLYTYIRDKVKHYKGTVHRNKRDQINLSDLCKSIYYGVEGSFEKFIERYDDYLNHYIGECEYSEDIKQDIYIYIIDYINKRGGDIDQGKFLTGIKQKIQQLKKQYDKLTEKEELVGEIPDITEFVNDEIINKIVFKQVEKEIIDETIRSRLTKREQLVIKMYYYDELSLDLIAREFNVTRERIRQIIRKALRKLLAYKDLYDCLDYDKKVKRTLYSVDVILEKHGVKWKKIESYTFMSYLKASWKADQIIKEKGGEFIKELTNDPKNNPRHMYFRIYRVWCSNDTIYYITIKEKGLI